MVHHLKGAEGLQELTRSDSEVSRAVADFAQRHNHQDSPRGQPFCNCVVKAAVDEEVTEEKIDRWARWKSVVEVEHIESAPIPNARPSRQLSCQTNCDGGYVDSPVVHAPLGQPNRSSASATGKFEGMPGRRHEMFNRGKKWRQGWVIEQRRQPAGGIPLVPMLTVSHAHQPNRTRHLGAPTLTRGHIHPGSADLLGL